MTFSNLNPGGPGQAQWGSPSGQISIGDTEQEGTLDEATRADHLHAVPAAPAGEGATDSAPGDAEEDGTATTPARSDHVHGREAAAALATPSVAIGTVEQNTSSAALAVTVALALAPGTTGALTVSLGVGTTSSPAGVVVAELAESGPAVTLPLTFIVPPGCYYELTASLGGGTASATLVSAVTL